MITLSLEAAQMALDYISYIIGHATDNSCGDPDCCGGPCYDDDTVEEYTQILADMGIKIIE